MWILIGDTHFTDNARDAYRFELFNWIKRQQEKYPVAATFLAGDLCDAKDRHSATLVNKIVNGLLKLKPPVYIDLGNHDYKNPKNPFFKFLNHIEGIHFVLSPMVLEAGRTMAVIPHVRLQEDFVQAVRSCNVQSDVIDAFLVHQTFDGAIAETGARLTGLSASPIELIKPPLGVYAGDVHRPQTQGMVTYIGCPYHVRFGDNFEPRCIWVDKDGHEKFMHFDAPRKWSLAVRGPENILNNQKLYEGDQVKLTIEVTREEAVEWKRIKQDVLVACRELKLEVFGAKMEVKTTTRREKVELKPATSPIEIFNQFCKAENVAANIRETGQEIIGAKKNGN